MRFVEAVMLSFMICPACFDVTNPLEGRWDAVSDTVEEDCEEDEGQAEEVLLLDDCASQLLPSLPSQAAPCSDKLRFLEEFAASPAGSCTDDSECRAATSVSGSVCRHTWVPYDFCSNELHAFRSECSTPALEVLLSNIDLSCATCIMADAVSFDEEIRCEENRCRALIWFQGSCMIPPDAYGD
jgi:hypothetical protein